MLTDHAAGFFNDDGCRRVVIRLQQKLEETDVASGSDPAQIKRR